MLIFSALYVSGLVPSCKCLHVGTSVSAGCASYKTSKRLWQREIFHSGTSHSKQMVPPLCKFTSLGKLISFKDIVSPSFKKLKTTVCSFLRCLICNAKIARVKNNRVGGGGESPEGGGSSSIPVHVRGRTTNIMTRSTPGDILPRRLPTSVSGYSLCPTTSTPPPGATAGEVSDTNQETSHRYLKFYCLLQ